MKYERNVTQSEALSFATTKVIAKGHVPRGFTSKPLTEYETLLGEFAPTELS
jgi:hypothetical protein